MRPIEIESWTLRVIAQVESKAHAEDGLVELKGEWPKPQQAARQIAAMANAARGAEMLWIIGVDEVSGVRGADQAELADWFSAVRACFDHVHPDLQDLNVNVGDHTVVALLFQTDRAPFLVKNTAFGSTNGGPVEWEVPWREGRKTRTANREALLRLLGPLVQLPEIEPLECSLSVRTEPLTDGGTRQVWYLFGSLYVVPRAGSDSLVIPFHRCTVETVLGDVTRITNWGELLLHPPSNFGHSIRTHSSRDSLTIESSSSEVICHGPGTAKFKASSAMQLEIIPSDSDVRVVLHLHAVGTSAPSVVAMKLCPAVAQSGNATTWKLSPIPGG